MTANCHNSPATPKGGALIAMKHQSMLDTMAPALFLPRPVYVYKAELGGVPVMGAYLKRNQIGVDRGGHHRASAAAAGEDLAGPLRRPHGEHHAFQRLHRPCRAPGQHRAEPVEEEVLAAALHRSGHVGPLQRGGESGQLGGRAGRVGRGGG